MSVPSPTVVDEIHHARVKACYSIPLYTCPVSAGFPSPADEYLEGKLDLNQYLVPHPLATFYVRVSGNSMIGAGIHEGDLLIAENPDYPAIAITEAMDFQVWGVVTNVIHAL